MNANAISVASRLSLALVSRGQDVIHLRNTERTLDWLIAIQNASPGFDTEVRADIGRAPVRQQASGCQ
jgi:hypothetical protein